MLKRIICIGLLLGGCNKTEPQIEIIVLYDPVRSPEATVTLTPLSDAEAAKFKPTIANRRPEGALAYDKILELLKNVSREKTIKLMEAAPGKASGTAPPGLFLVLLAAKGERNAAVIEVKEREPWLLNWSM